MTRRKGHESWGRVDRADGRKDFGGWSEGFLYGTDVGWECGSGLDWDGLIDDQLLGVELSRNYSLGQVTPTRVRRGEHYERLSKMRGCLRVVVRNQNAYRIKSIGSRSPAHSCLFVDGRFGPVTFCVIGIPTPLVGRKFRNAQCCPVASRCLSLVL